MTSPLPVDIDTTYADSGTDASVKAHQQHHDALHARYNAALLAITSSVDSATQTSVATTSTTYAAVDATNLVVTFTAPASGAVLISLCAVASVASATLLSWAVQTGGTVSKAGQAVANGELGLNRLIYLNGLTAGTSYTYTWVQARLTGTGSAQTRFGGNAGQAVMVVQRA